MIEPGSPEHTELLEKLAGRLVVASISGGKDSSAMSLYLTELGIEHRRVFMDTGWEHKWTYKYLRGPLTEKLGPITEVQAKVGGMVQLVRKKGMFPARIARFCTQELKVKPIRDYLRSVHEEGHETINAVGIRWGESAARSKMVEWEMNDHFKSMTWRPILALSEAEVIELHTKHDLRPNPLYLNGATRVGCWPCIFARKKELRVIADLDPERVDEIRELETEVQEIARKRYAEKDETFESLGYTPPTFFHKHDSGHREANVPIDDVMTWAKTSRGGKQLELFAPPKEEMGCMRWGLCEADTLGDEQ